MTFCVREHQEEARPQRSLFTTPARPASIIHKSFNPFGPESGPSIVSKTHTEALWKFGGSASLSVFSKVEGYYAESDGLLRANEKLWDSSSCLACFCCAVLFVVRRKRGMMSSAFETEFEMQEDPGD